MAQAVGTDMLRLRSEGPWLPPLCSAAWPRCRGVVASFRFQPGWYPVEKHLPLHSATTLLPSPIFFLSLPQCEFHPQRAKVLGRKNSVMCVLAFQLCEALVPVSPWVLLQISSRLLRLVVLAAFPGGATWDTGGRTFPGHPRCCLYPLAQGHTAGWWPPNPQLLLWQMGIPLFYAK